MKKYSFNNEKIQFWAGAAKWNKASNRVLANSGFKKIGTKENGYVCRGKKIAINEYEKVKPVLALTAGCYRPLQL
ncbi:MAG: GNAT family N-acetyltransferase [Desulfobacteraceae bacterium]|nr:GNAT family N-acetyltransferase [Desulfobacteraceae bacterium]